MQVSVFGNPDLSFDRLPVEILPLLQKELPEMCFIHQDPNEDCQPPKQAVWWIIDTVFGIDKVTLIKDLSQLKNQPRVSAHDYDLSMELSLIRKVRPQLEIKIIGVPPDGNIQEIVKDIVAILSS